MKFELSKSFIGIEDIPSLIIAASDIALFNYTGKDEKKLQKINEEYQSLRAIISMYTAYCGREMMMPSAVFHGIYTAIEKEGEIVIDCIEAGDNPVFSCRWISHGREKELGFKLYPVVGR